MSDGSLSGVSPAADACGEVAVRFMLDAEASPGLLPRLLQPLRAAIWRRPHVVAPQRRVMHVEIALEAMPAEMVHLVEGNLRQVVGVQQVSLLRPAVELRRAA